MARGAIGLHLVDTIILSAQHRLLAHVDAIRVRHSSIVVVDATVAGEIYEFGPQGAFLRVIGRHGRSPDGYLFPLPSSVAERGDRGLAVFDAHTGETKLYGDSGTLHLNLGGRLGYSDRMIFSRDGDLLQLAMSDGISYFNRYDGNFNLQTSVALTGSDSSVLVWHFSAYAGFCYSRGRNRVYHVAPGGYRVTELDAWSGETVRSFGVKPPGYRALDEEFHELKILQSPEAALPIRESTTFLTGGMFLISDRYLMLGFSTEDDLSTLWMVHDLRQPGITYMLDSESGRLLAKTKALTTRADVLFGFVGPSSTQLDNSNGRIEAYRLVLR